MVLRAKFRCAQAEADAQDANKDAAPMSFFTSSGGSAGERIIHCSTSRKHKLP